MRTKLEIDLRGEDALWFEIKGSMYEVNIDTCDFAAVIKVDYESLDNAYDKLKEDIGELPYSKLINDVMNLSYEKEELLTRISDLEEKIEELENDIELYQEINEELRRR